MLDSPRAAGMAALGKKGEGWWNAAGAWRLIAFSSRRACKIRRSSIAKLGACLEPRSGWTPERRNVRRARDLWTRVRPWV